MATAADGAGCSNVSGGREVRDSSGCGKYSRDFLCWGGRDRQADQGPRSTAPVRRKICDDAAGTGCARQTKSGAESGGLDGESDQAGSHNCQKGEGGLTTSFARRGRVKVRIIIIVIVFAWCGRVRGGVVCVGAVRRWVGGRWIVVVSIFIAVVGRRTGDLSVVGSAAVGEVVLVGPAPVP